MGYPYQCLQICGDILVAASTSHLETFSLQSGTRLSSWSCASHDLAESIDASTTLIPVTVPTPSSVPLPSEILAGPEPPTKRRKLSEASIPETLGNGISTESSEHHSKTPAHNSPVPNIVALTATKNGKHVIAVSGEDKSIRVLEHDGNGSLHQLSKRAMPKRPCAIALTTDDLTIICADKFGDVYALPLLPEFTSSDRGFDIASSDLGPQAPTPRRPFVSAANDLTIHTARNRRALQNQLRQDQKQPDKSELKFEHQLLLGHVSMLTSIGVTEHAGRSYIVTADRDEHIRISRGIPQAHITENYCLGHKEFVAQILFPTKRPGLLLSGGGDDEIYVWDWPNGELLQKVDLRCHVENVVASSSISTAEETPKSTELEGESRKIAVSSMCHLFRPQDNALDTVVITCEGIPALFFFALSESGSMVHSQTLMLDGNPLSLVVDQMARTLIASVDPIHEGCTTTTVRASTDHPIRPLQAFMMVNSVWVLSELLFDSSHPDTAVTEKRGNCIKDLPNLANLLYSLENLRKRGAEE